MKLTFGQIQIISIESLLTYLVEAINSIIMVLSLNISKIIWSLRRTPIVNRRVTEASPTLLNSDFLQ